MLEIQLGCLLPPQASADARLAFPTAVRRQEGQAEGQRDGCGSSSSGGRTKTYGDCSVLAALPEERVFAARKALLQYMVEFDGRLPLVQHGGQVVVRFRLDREHAQVAEATGTWHAMEVTLLGK